jgi:hypothetical protein
MPDADFAFLVEDIKANGLLTPIVTFEDKVLDGRNRLKACQLAGVDPVFKPFEGDDPVTFVISANLHRRHLTTPQRKQVAAEILKRQPERSNRSVAAEVALDDKTIAQVRKDAEANAGCRRRSPGSRIRHDHRGGLEEVPGGGEGVTKGHWGPVRRRGPAGLLGGYHRGTGVVGDVSLPPQ